ncbi:MAG: hypothetical protein CO096_15540 [Armatimonadetes bacterium CG_4_9_14_3_um_filter_66_14]|nr:MAG: hypothetical protein CO096_15540 [Armatimonadetes bacterium CG_4_9_14_3_um_filter_66_14]
MVDLKTTFAGLELDTPLVVASAGITETVERLRKCQQHGAGAAVMKSWFEEEVSRKSPTPRFTVLRHDLGGEDTFTLMSYEQASEWDIERYAEEVRRAKAELSLKIIPSINGLTDEGWVAAAKAFEAAGADALELNTSCPHGSITFRGGAVEETIFHTVELVREAVSCPVIAKLSPMLTAPLTVAKRLEDLGVQGVTMFNRFTGLDIDPETEAPVLHGGYGGHGGPWSIQYPLRWISEVSPKLSLDIAASGGVANGVDVVKYLLAGATVVQTCTAVVMNGYPILRQLLDELTEWMAHKGYARVDEFRGKATSRIVGTYQVDRRHKAEAYIGEGFGAPCKAACPAGVSAQSYVRLIAERRFRDAAALIRSKNPFQSVCGRVCYHPCEEACTRTALEGAVRIRALKRWVLDWARERYPLLEHLPEKAASTGKRIAIVGAGPAGLAAAHDLALRGHAPTVFEALPEAGGMLRTGIPLYRLPRELLDEEIAYCRALGVEIRCNSAIGKDVQLGDLLSDGFQAVLLTLGAHRGVALGIPGEDAAGVDYAVDFLRRLNLGEQVAHGSRVAVIGGGNTALDAARCLLREGAREVFLVYRRTRDEMPATDEEVRAAEAEGTHILYLAQPTEILAEDGRVSGVRCVGGYLGAPAPDGRRTPEQLPETEYLLKVDQVLLAVAQHPDTAALGSLEGLETRRNGVLVVDDAGATSREGVFAAGDAAGRPGSVIEAIAHGKRVALAIDGHLRGEPVSLPAAQPSRVDRSVHLRAALKRDPLPPLELPELSAAVRVQSYAEIELPLTEEQAVAEAQRCLACGCGVGCSQCVSVCVYEAIRTVGDKHEIDPEKCDGCGLCTHRCPNRNISMVPVGA